jgi:hypothetical protein
MFGRVAIEALGYMRNEGFISEKVWDEFVSYIKQELNLARTRNAAGHGVEGIDADGPIDFATA